MEDEETIRNETFNTLANLPKEVLEVIGICADITHQTGKFRPDDNPLLYLKFAHNVQWLSRLITEMDPERPRGLRLLQGMKVMAPNDTCYSTLWEYIPLRRKILMYNRANPEDRLVEDGDRLPGVTLLELSHTVYAWFAALPTDKKRDALTDEGVI